MADTSTPFNTLASFRVSRTVWSPTCAQYHPASACNYLNRRRKIATDSVRAPSWRAGASTPAHAPAPGRYFQGYDCLRTADGGSARSPAAVSESVEAWFVEKLFVSICQHLLYPSDETMVTT